MEHTYTSEELIQTGKDLVGFLIEICNTANNINGFLKKYISLLTSEDGIYRRQEEAMSHFVDSSTHTQEEADKMMQVSRSNSDALQTICGEFQTLNGNITDAQHGRSAMNEKVRGLNERIKEISGFIKDIQDVSEQTNLLSFNASIEAARAGVAGKGFRIIANEVKNLSGRTTNLSNDIDSKVRELQQLVQAIVDENRKNDVFMDSLQKTAVSANARLSQIQNDNKNNIAFMQQILSDMNENQKSILSATKETEKESLAQIQSIVERATENTIHTGDELSFLFELRKLFEWFGTHRELFA